MQPDRWKQISECLDGLLDRSDEERTTYLKQLQNENPSLFEDVKALWSPKTTLKHLDAPPSQLLENVEKTTQLADSSILWAGKFQLQKALAQGGMGVVCLAHDPEMNRPVAIKMLLPHLRNHPEAESRFLREAQITGQLQHPGIPPIHEIGRLGDRTPYFAMKLIAGRTLAELIRDRQLLPSSLRVVSLFEQICQTVAYAHSQQTIHRDLKPSNIMVGEFGEVQVMDWGIAKRLNEPDDENTPVSPIKTETVLTQSGDVRGTPAYMAPEQARGESDIEYRSDVFGLGGIMLTMLTGSPPFQGSSAEMLAQARLGNISDATQRIESLKLDPELTAILLRSLAPVRENRYPNAEEVARVVKEYREGIQKKLEQAQLDQQAALLQAREEKRRRKITVSLVSVLLVVFATGFGFATRFWLLAETQKEKVLDANNSLSIEKEKVQDANISLSAEKIRTDETAREARKAVRDSYILASENPEFQKDGMQEARRLLLDRALRFFQDFTKLRGDDPALKEDIADAHTRVGEMLTERGQHANAVEAFEKAITLFKELGTKPHEVAHAYRRKSDNELKLGKPKEAFASLTESKSRYEELHKADPKNPELLFQVAQTQSEQGGWYYDNGKLKEAYEECEASLKRAEYIYNDLKWKKDKVGWCMAKNLVVMGHILKDQRKPLEAIKQYQRILHPMSEIVKANPTPHNRAELARVYGSLALVQSNAGQEKEAIESYRESIALRKELVRLNPKVPDYSYDLGLSYLNLTSVLPSESGKDNKANPEILSLFQQSIEAYSNALAAVPKSPKYHHGLAFVHIAHAIKLRRVVKDYPKAEEELLKAQKLFEALRTSNTLTPEFRLSAIECEKEWGQLEIVRKDFAKAKTRYENAILQLEQLIKEGFKSHTCRYEITRVIVSLGYIAQETGDFDELLRLTNKRVDLLDALLQERPGDKEITGSFDRALQERFRLPLSALDKLFPQPTDPTIQNLITHYEGRLSKWKGWIKDFPKITQYRLNATEDSYKLATQYALLSKPDSKISDSEKQEYIQKVIQLLKQGNDWDCSDLKYAKVAPAFAHLQTLPEYVQLLESIQAKQKK